MYVTGVSYIVSKESKSCLKFETPKWNRNRVTWLARLIKVDWTKTARDLIYCTEKSDMFSGNSMFRLPPFLIAVIWIERNGYNITKKQLSQSRIWDRKTTQACVRTRMCRTENTTWLLAIERKKGFIKPIQTRTKADDNKQEGGGRKRRMGFHTNR